MFTSLFQLEQKPVTVFSSADDNAPILTADPGSLKTLLKACLVTGYGGKTALGWQMLFESDDLLSAAFASQDPTASKFVFKIDNSGATTARLSAYQSMTDINTGVKPIVVDNLYDLHASSWRLIGHSKTFVLLLDINLYGTKVAYPILFGDLPRESKRLQPLCVMWSARKNTFRKSAGVKSTLLYGLNFNGSNPSSSSDGVQYTPAYPFVVNTDSSGANIVDSGSFFTYNTKIKATALYSPILSCLPDSTWTMLPMFNPLSSVVTDVSNLGFLTQTHIKATTGFAGVSAAIFFNEDCAIPINWWYA